MMVLRTPSSEPLDFTAGLAAFVQKRRVNLTRFHSVVTPNSQCRARVTPAKEAKHRQDPHERAVSHGNRPFQNGWQEAAESRLPPFPSF